MAMPTSGCIAILSAPQACGSINSAIFSLCGVSLGSLSALSLCADRTAPHCMREFYGYIPVSRSITASPTNIYWYPSTVHNVPITVNIVPDAILEARFVEDEYFTYIINQTTNIICVSPYDWNVGPPVSDTLIISAEGYKSYSVSLYQGGGPTTTTTLPNNT